MNIRRWLSALLLPLFLASLIIIQPEPSQAAGGGRMGGGSFRAPSMPRTGGYRGGYGGGYRGGYRGGGMGFPFIFPIFFGGGGLFGFFVLMAIAGVFVNALRGNTSTNPTLVQANPLTNQPSNQITMIEAQVGLLASAKALQEDLRQLAKSADTTTPEGLQKLLQETTLALLRQPDLWVYSNVESGTIPFTSAEATFNRLSMTERSKLQAEVTSNFSGQIRTDLGENMNAGEADATNEYIVVTLLIASKGRINLHKTNTTQHLSENLRLIGSTSSSDLIALEVIWQPEGQGDSLSAEELVTSYPNLEHL